MINNFVILIGAVKSGTTSLFNYLAEHPEVAPCQEKEPKFFSNPEIYQKGWNYYQSLWSWNAGQHKVALEATPNYTRATHQDLLNAAETIAQAQQQHQVKFKFIYLMRDPVERLESHYTHLAAWNQETRVAPLAEGINQELIDVSRYAMQVEEYYRRFAAQDILLLNFDDLIQNPAAALQQVCRFLEIDPDYEFQSVGQIYNSRQGRRKVALPGWRTVRQTKFAYWIARNTPSFAKGLFHNLFSKKVQQQVKFSAAQKEYVLEQLQGDLQQLQTSYGVNTQSWSNVVNREYSAKLWQ